MSRDLEGVEVFVAAVEGGSFSAAAAQLGLTRSAVGKAIGRLETRLGVRLFLRSTRSHSLTDEGRVFHERCLRALDEVRRGATIIRSGRNTVSGRLKVAMPVLFGRRCVQPILLNLVQAHPALELDLRFSDAVVDVIGEGFDLAVRLGTRGTEGGLYTRRIGEQRKLVCAAPSYLARRGTPERIEDLSGHDALIYWRSGRPFPWDLRDAKGLVNEPELSWRLQFDSLEAVADAAVAGHGLAYLPSWLVARQIESRELCVVLPEVQSDPTQVQAVWQGTEFMPMRLRAAIDALVSGLQPRTAEAQASPAPAAAAG